MKTPRLCYLAASFLFLVGCVEGQKPTPLKRFDAETPSEVQKKEKDVPADKAKVGAQDANKSNRGP
jgi:hypothetical protein